MTHLVCYAHVSEDCSGEAVPVVVRKGAEIRRTRMCAPCRAYARASGADVVDERPEWMRRLTGRDETGAVLNPEASGAGR